MAQTMKRWHAIWDYVRPYLFEKLLIGFLKENLGSLGWKKHHLKIIQYKYDYRNIISPKKSYKHKIYIVL